MTNEKKKQCIMKHLSSKNRDYRFLYDYSLLRPGTVKRIEKMAKEFVESGRDVEIDLPFRFRFKFSSAERALDYMLQIQLFYRLACVGVVSSVWMQVHHCQPTKLKGSDVADNLVTVPLPVHWYLHFLHGIIGEITGNKRLENHALNSCQIMQFEPDDLIRCGFDPVEVERVRKAHMDSRIYWSEERIRKEAAKYDTKTTFRRGCVGAHNAARRLGIIDELFANQRQSWTEESIRTEATKYSSKSAFYRGSSGAYGAALTRFPGLLDDLFGVGSQWDKWNEETIRTESAKYSSKAAFQCGCNGAYAAALKRFPGLIDDLFGAGRIPDKWNEESIRTESTKYSSKSAFKRGCGSAYGAALTRFPGLLDELFTNQYQSWDEEKIRKEATKYSSKAAFQYSSGSAYGAALTRFPGLLDELFGAGRITDKWNEETIRAEAAKYDTKMAFHRGYHSAYTAALKRFPGLIDELFPDSLKYQIWDEEKIRATARRYPTAGVMKKCTTHGGRKAYEAAQRLRIHQTLRFQPLTIFNRAVKRRSTKYARSRGTPKPQITNLFKPKTVDSTPSV
ncbi:hypothetical protein EniLVp02_0071 [Vibrio phage EniLVp02]